jgi:hypothetical protein
VVILDRDIVIHTACITANHIAPIFPFRQVALDLLHLPLVPEKVENMEGNLCSNSFSAVLPNKVYLKGGYFEKKVLLDFFTILVYPYK